MTACGAAAAFAASSSGRGVGGARSAASSSGARPTSDAISSPGIVPASFTAMDRAIERRPSAKPSR